MAGSRSGSEKLVDYGIIETISQLNFIKSLPSIDSRIGTNIDSQELETYYSITNSVFELLLAVISNYTSGHLGLQQKLREFFEMNGSAILNILRPSELVNLMALKQCKILTAIMVWIGNENKFIHSSFQGGSQNSIPMAFLAIFKIYSGSKWQQRLIPMNDLEIIKSRTISPFAITGSKKSVYLEDCVQQGMEICRNILLFNLNLRVPYFGNNC